MRALLIIAAAIAPATADAQSTAATLWKGLAVGDSPEVVAEKLASDPAIRSARVQPGRPGKEPQIAVRYRSDGIDVFGLKFMVSPDFSTGKLQRVFLTTAPMCANDAPEQFSRISAVLHDKYPESPVKFDVTDDDQVRSARLRGTDDKPATAGRVFRGSGVTVTYQQTFTAEPEPPSGYVTSPAAAALGRFVVNQYLARQRECDGTGNHRMTHAIIYMTNDAFDRMDEEIHKAATNASDSAKTNL
ncbi:UNVERIFIED_ORG: hypothetical protein M2348_001299 [Sphingomonas sp. R1F5B]